MALIVAPADGYDTLVSAQDADAYWASMGGAWLDFLPADRESALRRGTQYVLARGVKQQHLDPVHTRVKAATCEAAMLHLAGSLYATSIDAAAVTSERVGEIAVSYAAPVNGGRARFPVIDDLLRGLTVGGGIVELVRA